MTAVGAVRETNIGGPTAASPGIGLGPKCSLPDMDAFAQRTAPGSTAVETERLHAAFEAARRELSAARDHVARAAGSHEAEIFDAHLLLLDDDELVGSALDVVAGDPVVAEHAWRVSVDALAERFDQ